MNFIQKLYRKHLIKNKGSEKAKSRAYRMFNELWLADEFQDSIDLLMSMDMKHEARCFMSMYLDGITPGGIYRNRVVKPGTDADDELFLLQDEYSWAAYVYEALGDLEKAARYYRRAGPGERWSAHEAYEKLYEATKKPIYAAKAAFCCSSYDGYRKYIGDELHRYDKVAELYENSFSPGCGTDRKVAYWLLAAKPLEAARCYMEACETEEALKLYREHGTERQVADCLFNGHRREEALPIYDKLGDKQMVVRCYMGRGEPLDLTPLYDQVKALLTAESTRKTGETP